ncbi:tetratricopeptide repeat protein [Actinokineospora sp. NBRC 105648]|uniref:tetratricopeptide repeat protein n=1 Tax=Actinokineospora sp. NBRC 105648 TaxID=3032206 RepID=UPI0024A1E5B0|nr:tetratricopeptide repeat protein [Actinokineospora sp. NBRC 105648]GLZ43392.1 co-chaperone YbbN [Actinokineospora sp. NBRC 105648]
MTRPDPRQTAALSAALSRAVDLSALKARADAAKTPPPAAAGTSAAPTQGGAHAIDVTEAGFQAEVVERSLQIPVVVALVASWSAQSQQLVAVLEKLAAQDRGSWLLAKVDIELNPRVAQLFGVQAVPMVVAIAGGQPVDAFNDVPPEDRVRQWIDSILDALRDRLPGIRAAEAGEGAAAEEEPAPEPEDERFTTAEAAFDRGDFPAAETAYQAILDAEPGNTEAKAALAQVKFLARAQATDPSVIVRADISPDDVDAQLSAADLEVAGQQVEQAFARLIAAVRRSSGPERDKARTHLVSLFDLFAADDQRVAKARRDLASALF